MSKQILNALVAAGTGLALCAVAPLAVAGPWRHGFVDHARVIRVQPRYRVVRVATRHRQCRRVPVARGNYAGAARDTVIGTIVGGVVGHQFGGGTGRSVATVAGAVLGAVAGSHYAQSREAMYNSGPDYRRVCRVVTEYRRQREPDGYRVTYRYHGRVFHARLPHDPGRRLRVRVRVQPLGR